MKRLIEGSIRLRGLIIAAGAGLLIFGFTQLPRSPIDSLPEFKPTVVEVQTEALGLSAEEVEQFITVPLEQDLLNGIAFLDHIESASLPGLSSVVMTFEPGTDLLDARQVVNERLTQAVGVAGLPEVANPPQMLQPLSSTNRAAIVRLSSADLNPIEVSVLARWVIAPRLLGVEGVANVSTFGLRDRQLQVLVDPAELDTAGVTLNQVIRTAGNALEVSPLTYLEASKPGTGGFIDTQNQRLQIFHEQTIKTPEELRQVPLEDEEGNAVFVDGTALTIGDVADVVEGHQPLIGDALCSDGECQLLVIEKFPGANTIAVAEGVDKALDVMRPGMAGLDMDTSIYRPADYVRSAFSSLWTAILIGSILAVLILAAIFFSWRIVVVAGLAILVSLAAAVAVLILRGATFNLMIMAGLVLAVLIVIDDAVTDTERLSGRVRAEDATGQVPVVRRITSGLIHTRTAALYAALIALIAVVPALLFEGVVGAFLPPILTTYLLALGVSLVVAVTLTPALSAVVLDGTSVSPAVKRMHQTFDRRVAPMIGRPGTVLAALGLVVLAAISLVWLRPAVDPELRERDILVQLLAAPGTSLVHMTDVTGGLVDELGAIDGVRSVGAHIGRAVMSDQVTNVNESEIWVSLRSNADYDATIAAIHSTVDQVPGVSKAILTHSEERINEILRRTDRDIVVRVYGENPATLQALAGEVETRLGRIDGLTDLTIDHPPTERTLQVTTDLAAAQAVGLKPGDVRRTAAILLNGITVGNLFEQQKVFDVVVWGKPELRDATAGLNDLLITTDDFGAVRLGSVADVEVVDAPAVIRHESVATYLDVVASVRDRPAGEVASEVDAAIREVTYPIEYHAELLGALGERQSHRWLLAGMWAGAALFIFLLLQSALSSWRLAAVVLIELTVVIAGGLIAIWVTGGGVTLGGIAALFAIFALGVRQSILLVRRYQELQRQGIPFGPDLVVRGARDRMVPAVTTIAAVIAFMLPIVIRGRSIGFEIVQPMAVVIIGGALALGVFVLVVLPALYLRFGQTDLRSIWDDELFAPEEAEMGVGAGSGVDA